MISPIGLLTAVLKPPVWQFCLHLGDFETIRDKEGGAGKDDSVVNDCNGERGKGAGF